MRIRILIGLIIALALVGRGSAALAQSADDLAKATANPLASMISLPFQYNFDYGAGPGGIGKSNSLRFQPVFPFRLTDDWNVISRTVSTLNFAQDIFPHDTFGLGDTQESLFFSPSAANPDGIVWGIGPIFLLPTASDPVFGTGKWGIGPTGIFLVQQEKLTVGILANQIWSVAGDPARADVNQLYVQPFVSYALPEGQSVTANLEASYDWNANQWTVPLNLTYSKVFTIGTQPVSGSLGIRKYLAAPPDGPDWGARAGLSFLFPQK